MTKSKIGTLTRSDKTPKRRLVVRILVFDSQKGLVTSGEEIYFQPQASGHSGFPHRS